MPTPAPSLARTALGAVALLLLGAAVSAGIALLQGRPEARYGARIPLMAPYDRERGVEGGRFAQTRTWALTLYSVRLREGEVPDAERLRAAAPTIPYARDLSWVVVSRTPPADRPMAPTTWWNEWRAGFPMRALACSFTDDFQGGLAMEDGWAIPAGSPYGTPRHWIIPGRVLWPGLAANTLILAAGFYGLWRARVLPAAALRALRTRPGCCPRCGYDQTGLEGDAPCPECGREAAGLRSPRTPG